jgi:hypothetical protein
MEPCPKQHGQDFVFARGTFSSAYPGHPPEVMLAPGPFSILQKSVSLIRTPTSLLW